jgi:hypothetical protein
VREALENDIEEDGSPERPQQAECNIVDELQFGSGRGKSFVK